MKKKILARWQLYLLLLLPLLYIIIFAYVPMGGLIIAFKQYAEEYKLNFGFVRDINEDLFINNTEYHEDMSHDSWRPLSDLL